MRFKKEELSRVRDQILLMVPGAEVDITDSGTVREVLEWRFRAWICPDTTPHVQTRDGAISKYADLDHVREAISVLDKVWAVILSERESRRRGEWTMSTNDVWMHPCGLLVNNNAVPHLPELVEWLNGHPQRVEKWLLKQGYYKSNSGWLTKNGSAPIHASLGEVSIGVGTISEVNASLMDYKDAVALDISVPNGWFESVDGLLKRSSTGALISGRTFDEIKSNKQLWAALAELCEVDG